MHWIIGEDTRACVAASRRTPDALWTPPPDSGSGAAGRVIGPGQDALDDATMAHADEAAPSPTVHTTPEVGRCRFKLVATGVESTCKHRLKL